MNSQEAKEKLKKLFYTDLTSYEIQEMLNISQNEYNLLLAQVKKELGLQTNYRRIPSKLTEYGEDKYYIAEKTEEDDFEIISYAPTLDYAEKTLKHYSDNNEDVEYFIGQATEEHMLKSIEEDYFNKEKSWTQIMIKYKLSYHTFYKLLNKIKEKKGVEGTRTGKNTRYIYHFSNSWKIRKTVDGKQLDYGVFKDLDTAMKIRDYLENINWNYHYWTNNKKKIVEEITG